MKKKFIRIKGLIETSNFIREAQEVEGDVILQKGKFAVDAKSFLGILSIDITDGVTVIYPDNAIKFETFLLPYEEKNNRIE